MTQLVQRLKSLRFTFPPFPSIFEELCGDPSLVNVQCPGKQSERLDISFGLGSTEEEMVVTGPKSTGKNLIRRGSSR